MRPAINLLKRFLLLQVGVTIWLYGTPVAALQTNEPIILNVTVTNDKGSAIPGLTSENFSVNVDKRPQRILSLNGEVPASVGILIDTSESVDMYGPEFLEQLKQHLKAGLARFVQLGHPANEYFLMAFANDTAIMQDWTSEFDLLASKLDLLQFKGHTSLFDALSGAIPKVMTGRNPKHVLILFSDGNDNDSKISYKKVSEQLKRSDVVLYAVGVTDTSRDTGMLLVKEGLAVLNEITGYTGGRALIPNKLSKSAAFTNVFESFAIELRSQYRLVISPEESIEKEKWRKLHLTAFRSDVSGRPQKLIVKTRQGYYR